MLISATLAACFTPIVAAALPGPSVRATESPAPARGDRILVRPKADSDPALLRRTYEMLGCTVRQSFLRIGNLTVLAIPAGFDVRTTIGLLEKTGLFEYVEPDYIGHALAMPNDPRFSEQWSLNNTGGAAGIAGADIKAVNAWSIAHDASDVIVAVVDSGIRYTHQDLAANMWVNPGESGAGKETNGVDDDGDGYVDDVYGVNVLNHSGNPDDDWGHGTHVAGIIGAVGNNSLGVTGIAWHTKLMACKFIDGSGNYAVSDAVTALDYARRKGANVVLAAWGGYSFTSAALRDAFVALRDAGIIVVAAAGNSGTNNDTTPLYPASYEYPNVISVAATDHADSLASFSDYGALTVDLAAPGSDILSCSNTSNADYRTLSGTSMASAHVAGAVALVWSHFPTDTYQQVISRIVSTVDPVPALSGKVMSGGRLDLAAALTTPAVPVITNIAPPAATVGNAFTYQISATGSPTSYAATNLGGTGLTLNTGTGVISGTPLNVGSIVSQLTATNAAGTSAPVTLTVTVNAAAATDTTAPLILSFLIDLTTATNSTASYVVTFDEPVTGVTADDFTINTQGTATATITGVTAVNSSTYRVNFNFAGTSGSIQMAINAIGTGITDAFGNPYVGGGYAASDVVALIAGPAADLVPPTIASFVAGTPTSSAVTYTLTFSEPVTGVTASDFLLQKPASLTASVGTITSDTTHTIYTVPVNYTGNGTLQLMVFGGATANIRDAATNWFVGGTGQLTPPVTVGSTASLPVITSAATDTGDVGIAFIYQITASGSPTSYAATNLAGTGLSLDPGTGLISGTPATAGTIVSQLTATNAAGTSAAFTLTITVNGAPGNDTTPPTITSFRFDTANETTGSFKVTFSEPVSGVRSDAFVINTQGTAAATITGITGFADAASSTYWVNFNWSGTSGSIQMAIKTNNTGIADTAGNAFVGGGFAASDVVALIASPAADTTPPTVTSFAAGTPTSSAVAFTIAFSEPVTGVSADDFLLIKPTTLTATVGAITVDGTGTTYTVPVTYSGSGTLQLMVLGGSSANIRDAATNLFAGGTDQLSPTVTLGSTGSVPAITSSTTAAAVVGTHFSYQITASGSPTTYAATNLTGTGLSLDPNTGVISGTPSTAGTIVSQLTATNAFGTSPALTLTITVAAQPIVPVITSATSASATVGTAFSYRITATGSPTTFAATNLSGTGLTLDINSGTISGTPGTVGAITTQITAANTAGTSAPVTVTITVTSQAAVPVITSGTSASATVGESFTYHITATGSPTSFAATNLAGTGFSLDANTGIISGTPGAVGVITTQVTATNATGASAALTVRITVTTAVTPAPVVNSARVNGDVGNELSFTISATNSPSQFALSSGPAWLSINASSGVLSGTPTAAGTFAATVSASNDGGTGTGTITFVISPMSQRVDFAAPTSAIIIGQPVKLGATASSGLPITYGVISGHASLTGDSLTMLDAGPAIVRATQSGNDSWAAASADATITAQKASQTIAAQVAPQPMHADETVTLNVTATSGLPVTYQLVSGPGLLNGNTLAFNGATGTVVVRATQDGDDRFNGAAAVDLTFVVTAIGQQVYLGKIGADDFAATVAADNSHGTFATRLSGTGEALVAQFTIGANGSFSAVATSMMPAGASTQGTGHVFAATQSRTISGTLTNGVLSGTLPELGLSFTANIQGPSGATAPYAGLYTAAIPGSASGTAYLFVGTNGQAYALIVTPTSVMSGSGTVSAAGMVNITTTSGQTIAASLDRTNAMMKGTVKMADVTVPIEGLSAAAIPTDRLVNVSARLRVSGNDVTHASIAGFVISGTTSKQVLVRAVGPSLSQFGVTNPLPNPQLRLFDRNGNLVTANSGWGNDAAVTDAGKRVGAFTLTTGSSDAALIATLQPGPYTAQISSDNSGVALIEVYDLSAASGSARPLINISTRGYVGSGDDVLIGGFAVNGNQPKRVLIRALGPSLTPFGVPSVLSDPLLTVYDATGTVIATNDNWGTPQPISSGQFSATAADLTAASGASGAFPLGAGSKDAAVIITLNPGAYSAVVTGAAGNSGAALVEVYEIPSP